MSIEAELARLDRTIALLNAAAAAQMAQRRLDAPRGAWRHRLAWRRAAALRGGRIAVACRVLRRLPGYERVKVGKGRWAVYALLPFEGRVRVAEVVAPVLNARNRAPVVEIVEVAPLPAGVVEGLAAGAVRGTFVFTRFARRVAPSPASTVAEPAESSVEASRTGAEPPGIEAVPNRNDAERNAA